MKLGSASAMSALKLFVMSRTVKELQALAIAMIETPDSFVKRRTLQRLERGELAPLAAVGWLGRGVPSDAIRCGVCAAVVMRRAR